MNREELSRRLRECTNRAVADIRSRMGSKEARLELMQIRQGAAIAAERMRQAERGA